MKNINLPVELPIYFNTDDTSALESLGIEPNIRNCELKSVTFFTIDAIAPYKEDDGFEYSIIYSGGTEFACKYTYVTIKQILNL